MSNSLLAIRAAADSNTAEQKRASERKRNVLILINQYLIENGYIESAERLQHESGGVLNKFVAADNIDLSLILGEYEAYYEMRFDKKPKLVRKLGDGEEIVTRNPRAGSKSDSSASKKTSGSSGSSSSSRDKKTDSESVKLPSVTGAAPSSDNNEPVSFGVAGTSIAAQENNKKGKTAAVEENAHEKLENRYVAKCTFLSVLV